MNDGAEEAFGLNGLGEAAQAAGRDVGAMARYRTALSLALTAGDREQQARAHTGLWPAGTALGQTACAGQRRRRALGLYAVLGCPKPEQLTQSWPAGSASPD